MNKIINFIVTCDKTLAENRMLILHQMKEILLDDENTYCLCGAKALESLECTHEYIKAKMKQKKIEICLTTYVNCQLNIISGESIIRQIMLAKDLIKDKFGIDCKKIKIFCDISHCQSLEKIAKVCGVEKIEQHNRRAFKPNLKSSYISRRTEEALSLCSLICVLASKTGYEYPERQIFSLYKEHASLQFVDYCNKSPTRAVQKELDTRYAMLEKKMAEISAIASSYFIYGTSKCIFNPTCYSREELVVDCNSVYKLTLPAFSNVSLDYCQSYYAEDICVGDMSMENSKLKITFDENGCIISAIIKQSGKECMKRGNNFRGFISEKRRIYKNNYQCIFEQVLKNNLSKIKQKITLDSDSEYVCFENTILWRQKYNSCVMSFDTTITNGQVFYDTAFQRNTQRVEKDKSINICAHTFIDYYNDEYGVAFASNCPDMLEITNGEIRCGSFDEGDYSFSFAMYPHLKDSNIEKLSATFITPAFFNECQPMPSLFYLDTEDVLLYYVRKSAKSGGSKLRLFEIKGKNTNATLYSPSHSYYTLCDITENQIEKKASVLGGIKLTFQPYEIKTIILQ